MIAVRYFTKKAKKGETWGWTKWHLQKDTAKFTLCGRYTGGIKGKERTSDKKEDLSLADCKLCLSRKENF